MIVLAMLTLAVALGATVWATAYALTDTIPDLLWLDRARRANTWWDTIEAMHAQLDVLDELEVLEQLRLVA